MSIKTIAHLAHQRITSESGLSFKRSHFYELIAAAFGYGSRAALTVDAVLSIGDEPVALQHQVSCIAAILARCQELAYSVVDAEVIASRLWEVLTEQRIDVVRLSVLVRSLRGLNHDDREGDPEDGGPDGHDFNPSWIGLELSEGGDPADVAILLESLHAAAERDVVLAHYALALLYEPNLDPEQGQKPRSYWYEQRQKGAILEGVKIEWADAYERLTAASHMYEHHLRAAARLGHADALVDMARHFQDATIFDVEIDLSRQDPREMAELAFELRHDGVAKHWLTIAAESGDTAAMRELIEGYDAADTYRCWMWLHLAALHGVDLTKDEYRAIHEDGSDYDDDIGGPMYADGTDGIELPPLPPAADARALQTAREVFSRISSSPQTWSTLNA